MTVNCDKLLGIITAVGTGVTPLCYKVLSTVCSAHTTTRSNQEFQLHKQLHKQAYYKGEGKRYRYPNPERPSVLTHLQSNLDRLEIWKCPSNSGMSYSRPIHSEKGKSDNRVNYVQGPTATTEVSIHVTEEKKRDERWKSIVNLFIIRENFFAAPRGLKL